MTVERYPKLDEVVGGSVLSRVIFSLLDRKLSKVALHLICSENKNDESIGNAMHLFIQRYLPSLLNTF